MNNKYKMPTRSTLKQRSSTINNAFAMSITPYIKPSDSDLIDYYERLRINNGQCAYCLREGNGRDHLKPLVCDGMPTGYITDIHNLVPCCPACNSAKGSKTFEDWYKSEKNIERLKKLGLTDEEIDERYNTIIKFSESIPSPIDYEKIVGKESWEEYNKRREKLIKQLDEDQNFCNELYSIIMKEYQQNKELDNK